MIQRRCRVGAAALWAAARSAKAHSPRKVYRVGVDVGQLTARLAGDALAIEGPEGLAGAARRVVQRVGKIRSPPQMAPGGRERRAVFDGDMIATEQPAIFRLVMNLRTAQAPGLVLPQSLLLRADECIQ